jgi:hypothetical protein
MLTKSQKWQNAHGFLEPGQGGHVLGQEHLGLLWQLHLQALASVGEVNLHGAP